jgi:hypothetical protein
MKGKEKDYEDQAKKLFGGIEPCACCFKCAFF